MSNKYNEDYFYSSYAKNGVLALPCSNDKYINVREKPNKDGRIILKIANVLEMFYLPVYNRERNVVDRFYERETEINKISSRSKEEQIKLMQYKIYPIFVNDILKGDWTVTFVNKTHGLESRWNRTTCQTCHKEDFCDSCHETSYPMSHARAGFVSGAGSHCGTSCVVPVGSWNNTPSKNCLVCHKTRPVTKSGALHTVK